tara:strand:- start:518 stop:901 length:384 start_codon:yes stop_codon:yes gene_type:complete
MKRPKSYSSSRKNTKGKKFNGRLDRDMLYDGAWRRYRAVFLNVNTKCYSCSEEARVVDHVVAHKGCSKLFKDTKNHIPLCKKCHDTITALFDRHEKPKVIEKLEWIKKNRDDMSVTNTVREISKYDM